MTRTLPLTLASRVCVTKDQISSQLSGDVVILNLRAGVYHGLEGTGAWIWSHLQQPTTVADLRDAMLAEYDVTPDRCQRDLLALLDELARTGLIEVTDGPDI
jgi:Coenzyme PQQ synthesis protein D (PqqD)